jgi:hypothetical protein
VRGMERRYSTHLLHVGCCGASCRPQLDVPTARGFEKEPNRALYVHMVVRSPLLKVQSRWRPFLAVRFRECNAPTHASARAAESRSFECQP